MTAPNLLRCLVSVCFSVLIAHASTATNINSTWDGSSGSWSDPTRWSSDPQAPNNGGGDTFNVTIGSGSPSVDVPVTIDDLTLNGGTLTGSQDLTAEGLFSWSGGALSGTGIITANGGISLSGVFDVNGQTLVNTGSATMTTPTFPTMRLNGASALFDNQAGATFTAGVNSGAPNITYSGTSGTFQNDGTFNKVGSGDVNVSTIFDNAGLVDVQTGSLVFNTNPFTSTGSINVDAGAELRFASGSHTLTAGSTASGSGTLRIAGATTLTSNTDLDFGTVRIDSGTLSNASDIAVNGLLDWNSGTLSGAGRLTTNGGIDLAADSHFVSGKTLVNTGAATMTSGGSLYLNGPSSVFRNDVTGTFTAGGGGQAFINFTTSAGTFENDGTFNKVSGNTAHLITKFDNTGLVDVQGGLLQVSTNAFTSTGSVNVDTGAELRLASGSHTFAAGSTTSGGGMLRIAGATALTSNTDLDFGTVRFDSGTLSNASDIAVNGLLDWNSGTLSGAGTLTANGGIDLAANTHFVSGKTLVNTGAATMTSGGGLYLNGASSVFRNDVTGTFTTGGGATSNINFTTSAGTFENDGTFNKVSGNTLNLLVALENTGLIDLQGGTTSIGGSGSLTQTAGTLALSGGTLTSTSALNLQGGTLEGAGTINANVLASGAIILPGGDAAADDITLNGDLTLGGSGGLAFDLGGIGQGTTYDHIDVNGAGVLAGALQVSFLSGFESTVSNADEFTLLTANSPLTGTFANVSSGDRLTTLDGNGSFLVEYGTGSSFGTESLVLSDFQAVPEAGSGTLLALGLGFALAGRRRRD